jgi:hypothetical protein
MGSPSVDEVSEAADAIEDRCHCVTSGLIKRGIGNASRVYRNV